MNGEIRAEAGVQTQARTEHYYATQYRELREAGHSPQEAARIVDELEAQAIAAAEAAEQRMMEQIEHQLSSR